jgi:hypothetical protein
MWTAIAVSAALLGALLELGWGDDAWTVAAGFLLVACVAVCVVAGLQSRAADREVRQAIERLAAMRANDRARRTPGDGVGVHGDDVPSERPQDHTRTTRRRSG